MKKNFSALLVIVWASTAVGQVSPPRQNPPPLTPPSPVVPGVPPLSNNVRIPPLTRPVPGAMTNLALPPMTNALPGQPVGNPVPPGTIVPGQGSITNRFPSGTLSTNFQRQAPVGTSGVGQQNPPGFGAIDPSVGAGPNNGAIQPNGRAPLTPAQRAQINRLATDLSGIRFGAQATPANTQQLVGTLQSSIMTPIRPAEQTVSTLANNLLKAWPNTGFNAQQRLQLAIDLNRIVNSAVLSPTEAQLVINDAQRVLQAGGMDPQAVSTVVANMSAIVAEVQRPASAPVNALPADNAVGTPTTLPANEAQGAIDPNVQTGSQGQGVPGQDPAQNVVPPPVP